jgi:hypothetical protein
VSLADVNRFIDDDSLLSPPDTTNAAVITEVLHIWGTDSDYLGPYGLPLELDLEETPGRNLSTLVFRADPTADPRIVLRDMIENEIVKPVGERHFRASARSFLLPDIMTPQALEYFGRTITDLANTIEFNMKTDGEGKRLQRSVVADGGLPDYALPEFEALLKEKVQKLLLDIDDWLSNNKVHWVQPGRTVQTGLTAFHYVTEPYDARPLSNLQPRDQHKDRFLAWIGTPERLPPEERIQEQ